MNKIGLIAGNGTFPIVFARAAKQKGMQVIAVAHEGETLAELAQHVDVIFWVKVGQLNKLISIFKEQGVTDVLMAGGIKKTRLFGGGLPDLRGIAMLAKMIHKKDDSILRAVAKELESEGITVRESSTTRQMTGSISPCSPPHRVSDTGTESNRLPSFIISGSIP